MAESEDYEDGEGYLWMDPLSGNKGSSHHSIDRKRRFSEEQVKSLELIFESQTKLEPRKKMELAKELGLHPRQVAIWFQNKRARWKSKQLEREYNALRADYDALLSSFESLKNEKHLLAKQLQKLAQLVDEAADERGKKKEKNDQHDERPNSVSKEGVGARTVMSSDDEENNNNGGTRTRTQEMELFGEQLLVSQAPEQHQFFLQQPSWAPDQSCAASQSQWWDFWPVNE